jgi:hypothetical protein
MRIIVRRNHIDEAIKNDSHHCMIHDAIKEYLGVQFISVDTQSIRFSDPATKERYVYLTPPIAQADDPEVGSWHRGAAVLFRALVASPSDSNQEGIQGQEVHEAEGAAEVFDAKRRDPMAPRLVKKNQPLPKPRITRHRKFGIRQFTKQ